jgi:hypothetical protein
MDQNADPRSAPGAPQQVTERTKARAEQTAQGVQREAQQRANEGKERVAKGAEDLSRAGQRAAEDLEARGQQDLAEGLRSAANKLSGLADGLHHRSANDLLHDAEDLARRNPALFIGGSIVLGLALSRLLKASDSRQIGT